MNNIGAFSPQDYEVLGYPKEQTEEIYVVWEETGKKKLLSKERFCCFDFALLEVRERGVREQLFTHKPEDMSFKACMEERLGRWGYEVVELPKAGDLVLYFNENDLNHMGVYLKSGQVKSNPGHIVTYYIIHPVQALCPGYGSTIVYYRKNPKLEGKFKEGNVP